MGKLADKLAYNLGRIPKSHTVTDDGRIHYYNFGGVETAWFHEFIKRNVQNDTVYNFISVFGSKLFCLRHRLPHSVFYSSETVHTNKPFLEYRDLLLDRVDLSMSFDRLEAPNYLRFPNWIAYLFEPIIDRDLIRAKVAAVNNTVSTQKYEAVLICNHDGHKTRAPMVEDLQDILDIKIAGQWRNNTRQLWDEYDNDKIRYVHEFKFNICPENRNVVDYVTEKIFEAFAAGSIPLYYGSKQRPEPDIINQNALLFWDVRHSHRNDAVKNKIHELNTNPRLYQEFLQQEKLKPYTVDYVYDTLRELKARLEKI
ncbi:MAG: hypothetical protein IJ849_05845 [Selenomonadaceae bacterium]|nr:hypothetical protein [Selenomonadaceae bacterium]